MIEFPPEVAEQFTAEELERARAFAERIMGDDTQRLQRTLNEKRPIPPGRYTISRTLVLQEGTVLQGVHVQRVPSFAGEYMLHTTEPRVSVANCRFS